MTSVIQEGQSAAERSQAFVSTREAAALLGVALRTVQLWVENGSLQAWKTVGGHRRIARESVTRLLDERERALSGDQAEATTAIAAPAILAVDDDAVLLRLYRYNIESWQIGARLLYASNGFEGLRMLGESEPEVLITDLNMPGIDGFRMLRAFADWPRFGSMLVVAATALSPEEVADRGGLPSGVMLMTKPINFALLEQLVRHRLKQTGVSQIAASV